MRNCKVCGKEESQWPTINRGGATCSENCKETLKDLDRRRAILRGDDD